MTRSRAVLACVAAVLLVLAMPAAASRNRLTRAVADTTPPTIQQPPDMTVAGTVPGSFQPVIFGVGATDPDDAVSDLRIHCDWSTQGVTFFANISTQVTLSVGGYTMTCHAYDPAGNNSATVSFALTVTPFVDTTPPVFHLNNITGAASSPAGLVISQPISVSDPDDDAASITKSCDHNVVNGLYPIGVTTVTCNAHDPAGNNAAPASFTVTITNGGTTTATTTATTTTTPTTTATTPVSTTTTSTATTTTAVTTTTSTTPTAPPASTTGSTTTSTTPTTTISQATPTPAKTPVVCVVPKLVGLMLSAAQGVAQRHNCRLTVSHASNKRLLKGRVVAQRLTPGERFRIHTQIPIIVSTGSH